MHRLKVKIANAMSTHRRFIHQLHPLRLLNYTARSQPKRRLDSNFPNQTPASPQSVSSLLLVESVPQPINVGGDYGCQSEQIGSAQKVPKVHWHREVNGVGQSAITVVGILQQAGCPMRRQQKMFDKWLDSSFKLVFLPSICLVQVKREGQACTFRNMCVEGRGQLAGSRSWARNCNGQVWQRCLLPSEPSLQPRSAGYFWGGGVVAMVFVCLTI